MGWKCSHCGNKGHNTRTCTSPRKCNDNNDLSGALKLFGVQLPLSSSFFQLSMKKSFSTDCFPSSSSTGVTIHQKKSSDKLSNGSLSDGLIAPVQERKKGVPWTVEEHRAFLIGLEKLGKGDWRGISKNFVTSRTPTQVASHAQKYFLGLQKTQGFRKRKRRQSLFDVGSHEVQDKVLNPCTGSRSGSKPGEATSNFCGLLLKANPSNSRNRNIREFQLLPIHQNSSPKCLSESSLNVKPATNSCDRKMLRAATGTPNLELTLAAPTPLNQIQRKECKRGLLTRAIRVI